MLGRYIMRMGYGCESIMFPLTTTESLELHMIGTLFYFPFLHLFR